MTTTTTTTDLSGSDSQASDWADDLVGYLARLKADKAALADLRSGLRRTATQSPRLHRYLARFVPEPSMGTGREVAVYTVGALFGRHRDMTTSTGSLGASLRALVHAKKFSEAGVEQRLRHLVRASDSESLAQLLPAVVALLDTAGIPISWAGLARDIRRWDSNKGRVSQRWLRDFYRTTPQTSETTETSEAQ